MRKFIVILVLNITAIAGARGQDPVFSQFYTSSLYLNPALAGFEKDVVIGMNYRSQWAAVNLPFRTFQFSLTHPIVQHGVRSKHLGGFGATLFSDDAGANREVRSQGLSFASSYNFHLSGNGNHILAAGLQFGVHQRQINMNSLQWSSQYSDALGFDPSMPGEQVVSERVTGAVINAGIAWRLVIDNRLDPLRIFYQGATVSNLNRPRGFFPGEKGITTMLYKIHGGYLHTFRNGFELSPNYVIQHQQSTQINVGAYAAYAMPAITSRRIAELKVSMGAWYRINDSFILTGGLSTSAWSAGFSYDTNSASMERVFPGANAFEISFAYRIRIEKSIKKFSTPLI